MLAFYGNGKHFIFDFNLDVFHSNLANSFYKYIVLEAKGGMYSKSFCSQGTGSITKYSNWNRRPNNTVYVTLNKENTRSGLGRYRQEEMIREDFLEELSFELAQRVKSIFPGFGKLSRWNS